MAQKKAISPSRNKGILIDPVEIAPELPGGLKAYNKFLKKNLKWPSQDDVQGRVIISFVVEKDGRLTNFKIERKLWPEFDKEALRVIRMMPRWKPAIVNGKPVRRGYTIPMNFTLSE